MYQANPLASAFGNIMGGFAGLNTPNPANSAMPYFNQIPGQLQNIYSPWMSSSVMNSVNPYLQNGQSAGNTLNGQYGSLVNNPTGMFNAWGSTYHASPGYNWQVGQATQAANNAAAAGGMAGSPAEQQSLASTVNGLANQDYWQYINNAQNLYSQGLQGLQNQYGIGAQTANNIYGIGANMANNYGENLSQALMNQGLLNYSGQINQNQSRLGGLGALGAGIGGLVSSLF